MAGKIKKTFKWLGISLLVVLVLGGLFVTHEWTAKKPFFANNFYNRAFLKFVLEQVDLVVTQAQIRFEIDEALLQGLNLGFQALQGQCGRSAGFGRHRLWPGRRYRVVQAQNWRFAGLILDFRAIPVAAGVLHGQVDAGQNREFVRRIFVKKRF